MSFPSGTFKGFSDQYKNIYLPDHLQTAVSKHSRIMVHEIDSSTHFLVKALFFRKSVKEIQITFLVFILLTLPYLTYLTFMDVMLT